MKLTKYNHACLTIEINHTNLIVDPGNLSSDFIAPENVTAVVITHFHPDHLDHERLAEIFDKNDDVLVIGPADVIATIEAVNKRVALPGDCITVGDFDLEFFGGDHAVIHHSLTRAQNLGVMINSLLYYPGDSFAQPNQVVDTLALPVSAPWLKISEAIDFLGSINPRLAFPTHDAILSDEGRLIVDRVIGNYATEHNLVYERLSDSIEI